jgi:hypothetical protein
MFPTTEGRSRVCLFNCFEVSRSSRHLSDESALSLLASKRFNVDRVSHCLAEDGGQCLALAWVSDAASLAKKGAKLDPDSLTLCPICYDESILDQTFSLAQCGHRFCYSCWNSYLDSFESGAALTRVTCPDHECDARVDRSIIKRIKPELEQKWETAILID